MLKISKICVIGLNRRKNNKTEAKFKVFKEKLAKNFL